MRAHAETIAPCSVGRSRRATGELSGPMVVTRVVGLRSQRCRGRVSAVSGTELLAVLPRADTDLISFDVRQDPERAGGGIADQHPARIQCRPYPGLGLVVRHG